MRWRPGRIARNTVHASTWSFVRIALQALNLVLLARVVGANGYGAIAGSVALFMTCGQFTGLGSGIAFVRHVARGGEPHSRFATTELTYLLSGLLLFALIWPFSTVLLGTMIPSDALAYFAAADLLIAPTLQPLVFRYQAEERMFLSSAIGTLIPVARLAAVVSTAWSGLHGISSFAQMYLAWIIAVTAITLYLTWPRGVTAKFTSSTIETIREGLPYAISSMAFTAGNELDKTVLLRLAGEAVTGPYAAAYRIVTAATLPVNGLILATSPRLFQTPSARTGQLVGTMFTVVLGYALIAATLLWLLAPLAPWLLGNGFTAAKPLLRGLCLVVVTGSVRQLVTALLTTGDMQKRRNLIEIGGVCALLLLLLLLVPRLGAYGAIIAVACGDLCVLSVGALALKRQWQIEQEPAR